MQIPGYPVPSIPPTTGFTVNWQSLVAGAPNTQGPLFGTSDGGALTINGPVAAGFGTSIPLIIGNAGPFPLASLALVNVSTTTPSILFGARARGTPAAPGAVLANDILFGFEGGGYDGTAWGTGSGAIFFVATDNWAVGDHGMTIQFRVAQNGAVSAGLVFSVDQSQSIALGPVPSYGTGKGVFFMANAITIPSTNPVGGGLIYVSAGGALIYRSPAGTLTTMGAA